ncbi:MAG: UDP-galactopyranose mutase, partial [Treponema sp.]|nr:UDP-galactopyranose mutase [Treponema sp.]
PVQGYTALVAAMLEGVEVRLETDFLADKQKWLSEAEQVIYTGPIDAYFGYEYGPLEYRSLRFETEVLDTDNYQGNAVVNYTEREVPFTRIIEHKHFVFGQQPKTVITREYSKTWQLGDEPYYPVGNAENQALYGRYRALAEGEPKVVFGGRLGEYKYYDMDQVLARALETANTLGL